MSQLTERFGTLVFSDHVRKQYLPSDIYKKLNKTIEDGESLDLDVANGRARDEVVGHRTRCHALCALVPAAFWYHVRKA